MPPIDLKNLREDDKTLLATIEAGFAGVGDLLSAVKLREALKESFRLATEVNRYLDTNAPWQAIKTDRESAALTIYTALRAIDSLKILFAPFLPFTSQKLHEFFGYETPLSGEQYSEEIKDSLGSHIGLRYRAEQNESANRWIPSKLKPGMVLNQPGPLFKKLEPSIADEERAKLGD